MDAHELSCRLKALALELGRTPQRDEFVKGIPNGRTHIDRAFGTYAVMLEACGLDSPKRQRTQRITNEVFHVEIDPYLELQRESQKRDTPGVLEPWPTIAILGDVHEPFSHASVKQDFVTFVGTHKPQHVVQIGDAFDAYAHAKFPRSHNLYTPKDEEQAARKNLEELWRQIQKASPASQCIQLVGNHDLRPMKRVLEALPAMEHWAMAYFKDLMKFDGVHTVIDPREEYFISDIAFIHGYRTQLGAHRDYMRHNAVVGHTHRGGAVFKNIQGQTIWELNAGFAADAHSKGLSYTSQKMVDWTLGWGFIDEHGPRFIPYRK